MCPAQRLGKNQIASLEGFALSPHFRASRGLPAQIQIDGVGAALAFMRAKGKEHHLAAYHHLEEWLRQPDQFNFQGDLLEWLVEQSTVTYRQVSSEALAYLVWLKRFVEAKGWESNDHA